MDNKIQSITSKLWAMANELRGNMDASEFKNYILSFMFYRYLSEHQERYLAETNVLEPREGMTINDIYMEEAVGEDLNDYLEEIALSLGYAIAPEDTWESLCNKINDSSVIPSDYQNIFDNFNNNVKLNTNAEEDFTGVFNDINLGDSRLGATTTARAKALSNILMK